MKLLLSLSLAALLEAGTITSITHSFPRGQNDVAERITIDGSAGEEVFLMPWGSTGLWQWDANSHGQFVLQFGDTHAEPAGDNFLLAGRYGVGDPTLHGVFEFTPPDYPYPFKLSPDPTQCWNLGICPDLGIGPYSEIYWHMNGPLGVPIYVSESGLVSFRFSVMSFTENGDMYADVDASFQLEDLSASASSASTIENPEPSTWGLMAAGLLGLAGVRHRHRAVKRRIADPVAG